MDNLKVFKSYIERTLQALPRGLQQPRLTAHTPINPKLRIENQTTVVGCCAIGFGAVCTDVTAPWSLHILQPIDLALHNLVTTSIGPQAQLFADKVLSDGPILLGLTGWAWVIFQALLPTTTGGASIQQRPKAQRTLGTAALMYVLAGGSFPHWDPPLINFLKDSVHRARPSLGHNSYSFPSGHTTGAAFIVGTLLFILLPSLEKQTKTAEGSSLAAIGMVVAVCTTASGRVLADAHWVSDVVAGGLLGGGLVASTALLCEVVNAVALKENALDQTD